MPGLVAEADTPEDLLKLLSTLIPEIMDLNGNGGDPDVPYSVMLDHLRAQRVPA